MAEINSLPASGLDRVLVGPQRTHSVQKAHDALPVPRRSRRQPVLLAVPAGRRGANADRYLQINQRWLNALRPGDKRAFWYDTTLAAYMIEESGGVAYHVMRVAGTRKAVGVASNLMGKPVRREPSELLTVEQARQRIISWQGKAQDGGLLIGATARTPAAQATGQVAGRAYLSLLRAGKRKRNKGSPASPEVQRRIERIFGIGADGALSAYADKAGAPGRYVRHVDQFLRQRIFDGGHKTTPQDAIAIFEGLESKSGAQVAKDVCEVFRLATETQRLQIDAKARPANPFDVLAEGNYYPAKKRGDAKPFTTSELRRYVLALNEWRDEAGAAMNPVHRYVAVIQLLCGFRRKRSGTLRWDWLQADEIGAHLLISAADNLKANRDFPFPVTPFLATVLDECRAFGDKRWVTPGSQNNKRNYRGGPVNSNDWWWSAFDSAKVDRSGRKGSKRVRQTMATWLAAHFNSGLPATALLGHSGASAGGKSSGAAEVTTDHYLNLYRAGKAHEWLQAWHDHLLTLGLVPVLRR